MYARRLNNSSLNFLASEKYVAFPEAIDATNYNVQLDDEGRQYVPAGTVYPTNDAKAIGVTIDDVYVNNGAQLVGVIREGWLLSDRMPVTPSADAIKAMTTIHFKDLEDLGTSTSGGSGTTSSTTTSSTTSSNSGN